MAAPTEWLNEFQVNTGTADVASVEDPQIIGLSNGNFLVAWTELGTAGVGTQAGRDIIGKIFDAEGNLVRDSYILNSSSTEDEEGDFNIAATNDGGFILVYQEPETATQSEIHWERHNAAGNQTNSAQIAVENVAGDNLSNPTVVVNNANNTSYVTFTDNVGGDDNIRAVRVSATGTVLTAEFNAAQNSADPDSNGDTAINSNGELVSIYEEDDGGVTGIEIRVYSTTGVLQHQTQIAAGPASDPHVATLTNGNIVATWVEGNDVRYSVMNANLVPDAVGGGPFNTDGSADVHNEPQIVALPDGGFVIVWDNDTDNTLEARRFNENGSVSGTDTVFQLEPTAGTEITPNIGVTGDGRILFTWEEGDNVFSSIWDTREATIDSNDYTGLNPPINFINADEVLTTRVQGGTFNGDGGPDTILGQGGNDIINGGGGLDTIQGGGGNDIINGGAFTDEIDGGIGNDTFIISNGDNSDNIVGGNGTDTLDLSGRTTGSGANINLDAGTYTLQGAANTISSVETISGTQLNDTITSTFGNQTLNGNGGNDTFIHGNGQFIDDINGGSGSDTLDLSGVTNGAEGVIIDLDVGTWTGLGGTKALISIDTVIGTQQNDVISSTFGTQTFDGQGGSDVFINGDGQFIDNIDGGTGFDTLDMSAVVGAAEAINVDLNAGTWTGLGGTRTIANMERIIGTQEADTMVGRNFAERFDGGVGNDTLTGNGGNDTLVGGDGNDDMFGGAGVDLLLGGNDNDTLNGGAAGDTLNGGGGLDIASYAGASGVRADLQNSAVNTGDAAGDTYSSIEGLQGSGVFDLLYGDGGNNMVSGGNFTDRIYGRAGNDILNGENGNDAIYGNTGVDTMSGGAGNDRFIFFNPVETGVGAGNRDIITDFVGGAGPSDRIEISRFDANTVGGGANDVFNFIGTTAFSGAAGELRYAQSAPNNWTLVMGDTDGDTIADFQIELTGLVNLVADDFLL